MLLDKYYYDDQTKANKTGEHVERTRKGKTHNLLVGKPEGVRALGRFNR
jgi:hypothetical protein